MTQGPEQTAGVRLGSRYRLVERAGTGGMAVVWRAFDEVLNRRVAVKVLSPKASSYTGLVGRLRAEAQAVAQLSHPHITAVHDYGQDITEDGTLQPFVVMELVEGTTLRSCLADGQSMAWPQAVTIVSQIASALAAAHSHGIVHRDVTTSNVMLTSSGVKVLDFGIAALLGEHDDASPDRLLGTPAYVAPERLGTGPVTPAVDVYALGVIFYLLLAGQLPWQAATPVELLEAHLRSEPDPLPDIDGLPPEAAELCLRCLAKEPEERPSAGMLASLLDRSLELAPKGLPMRRRGADSDVTSLITRPTDTDTGGGTGSNAAEGKPVSVAVAARVPRRFGTAQRVALAGALAAVAVTAVVMTLGRSGRPDVTDEQPGRIAAPAASGLTSPSSAAVIPGASAGTTNIFTGTNGNTGTDGTNGAGPGADTSVSPPAQSPAAPSPTGAPSPSPVLTTVSAQGGTIEVYCAGDDAVVERVIPAAGFTTGRLEKGPAALVRAVFTSATHASEIKVNCPRGRPQPNVRERSL